jgi:hypothetical protein
MAPLRLEHGQGRWGRWAALAGVIALMAVSLAVGPHRRTVEHLGQMVAREGWQLQAASEDRGLVTTVLREARLSWRQAPGIVIEVGRVEIRHWPWLRPRVKISNLRGDFHGDVTTILQAVAKLATWGTARAIEVPAAEATFQHPAIGRLVMSGIRLISQTGAAAALDVDHVRIGNRAWRSVELAVERHKDMFVIGWGAAAAGARIQLSCFPSSEGKSRWLLNVPHQGVCPLAARIGWQLGPDFEAARIAGALSLDIPDPLSLDAVQPVRGRVQLVLDGWPARGPASTTPLVGSTLSLVSNLVPAANGTGWDLPRVELSTPVFDVFGPGQVDLSSVPRFALEATGERTCQQLRALLPPSSERDRIDAFLAGRRDNASKNSRVRLDVVWRASEPPVWRLEGGCGLEAATF